MLRENLVKVLTGSCGSLITFPPQISTPATPPHRASWWVATRAKKHPYPPRVPTHSTHPLISPAPNPPFSPQDYSLCATGLAGGSSLHHYTCRQSHPGPPTAAGATCFSSVGDCTRAANGCDVDFPCAPRPSACQTGLAADGDAERNTVFCDKDIPPGAAINGGGQYCYSSRLACDSGPNAVRGGRRVAVIAAPLPIR